MRLRPYAPDDEDGEDADAFARGRTLSKPHALINGVRANTRVDAATSVATQTKKIMHTMDVAEQNKKKKRKVQRNVLATPLAHRQVRLNINCFRVINFMIKPRGLFALSSCGPGDLLDGN